MIFFHISDTMIFFIYISCTMIFFFFASYFFLGTCTKPRAVLISCPDWMSHDGMVSIV
jgi:hypothetical protein